MHLLHTHIQDMPQLIFISENHTNIHINANAVHIWQLSLNDIMDTKYHTLLSEAEHLVAASFATLKLSERYKHIHGWMRFVLSKYLKMKPESIKLKNSYSGKPSLEEGDVHFNLSHCDSLALLAICKTMQVGIDVEDMRHLPESIHIARQYFSEDEICWITDAQDQDRSFLRCWVCREAILKATGEGLKNVADIKIIPHKEWLYSGKNAAVIECSLLTGQIVAIATI